MLKNIVKNPAFLALFVALFLVGVTNAQDKKHNHSHSHSNTEHNHDHSSHNHDHSNHAGHDHSGHNHDAHNHGHDHSKSHGGGGHSEHGGKGDDHSHGDHDYNETVLNHINDANEIHLLGPISIPLPCILVSKDRGVDFCMSSKFHHGHNSYNGYVAYHGNVKRVDHTSDFPQDKQVEVHFLKGGKQITYNGKTYDLEEASALSGISSWADFSISKAVVAMLLAAVLLFFIFRRVARRYTQAPNEAPKGVQAVFEPLIVFLTDNVMKPIIGPKYIKYAPFLLTLFFFIVALNLFGLVPGFGFNASGNLSITLTLAVITLLVYLLSGNKHYWGHMLWMPGLPVPMKILMGVIEAASNFLLKPATLMLRLFANITGGHIVILSLIGLIWVFGDYGKSMAGGALGAVVSTAFVLFMNVLELLVAFLQAFIFMTLASVYIGQAVEEPHHEHH